MDQWDSLKKYKEQLGLKRKEWVAEAQVKKNKMSYLFDKHKVVRKMFILGIGFNLYLIYRSTCSYLQVSELNNKIKKDKEMHMDRMNVLKYELLDSAKEV